MLKKYRSVWMPLLAAMIWGTAFVAQSVAAGTIGALTYNCARSVIATVFIGSMILVRNWFKKRAGQTVPKTDIKQLILGGVCCGIFLTAGCYFQQKGMETTSAGKAGFITALYVVLVPVAGLFFKRRVRPLIWLCVLLAIGGLYFLCIKRGENLSVETGDLLELCCAVAYTGSILCIDHFSRRVDGIMLSCAQFAVQAIICAFLAPLFETPSWSQITSNIPSLLYVGILSSGVAYTLQILAQACGNATVVSLLFSLESFFAVVSGAIILGDRLTGREYIGCGLMLAAVLLSQLPARGEKDKETDTSGEKDPDGAVACGGTDNDA